ncbi:rubrerythrin [Sulfuricella sp. T08]|uniref:ferritin-like domain-containing protein n=1 Tax=Sulfuricella sp. T08 TaxID=1632857 RepID=UPI0006179EE7|nr:ferritin family protein [Sulfuricella sp. T08]GAO36769.1 rubrerythrin [Sulfuricella sp. T08]
MEDIHQFLAHAVELEREAARRYEELAESMQAESNSEVEKFFRRMAKFSRKHLALAMERGGFRQLPVLSAEDYVWPDGVSPEQFDWIGVDAMIDVNNALDLALDGERRGHAFYADIASTTSDPEVRSMAEEFASEEAEHVAELEKWIAHYAVQTEKPRSDPKQKHPATE